MIKQIIAMVGLSVGVVVAMAYAQQGVQLLISSHDWVSEVLTEIFSGGNAGNLTRQLIALLAIPVLVGISLAVIYWVIRRSFFPYFMQFVWAIWLVQTAALVVLSRV